MGKGPIKTIPPASILFGFSKNRKIRPRKNRRIERKIRERPKLSYIFLILFLIIKIF